jgi:hypothetical protein
MFHLCIFGLAINNCTLNSKTQFLMKTKTSLILSAVLLGFIFFVGCSDTSPTPKQTEEDPDPITGPVNAPCTTDSNSCSGLNGEKLSFYHTSAGENQAFYGEYGILGNGSQCDFRIDFNEAPETGKYVTTTDPTNFNWLETQCAVSGTFGGTFSYHYMAARGDTVYVNKTGDGKYIVEFCNMKFSSSQSQFEFESKGGLIVD